MVLLQFHLDESPATDSFWWIDSPDVPSLYVSAETIDNARRLAMTRLEAADIDVTDVHYEIINAGQDGQRIGLHDHSPAPEAGTWIVERTNIVEAVGEIVLTTEYAWGRREAVLRFDSEADAERALAFLPPGSTGRATSISQ